MSKYTYTSALEFREQAIEVKPCPFCGSLKDVGLYSDPVYKPQMRCDYCGACMEGDNDREALTGWNQRTEKEAEITMTEKRLKEIEDRVAAANSGPWKTKLPAQIIGIADRAAVSQENDYLDWICSCQVSNQSKWRANLEFIAHSREDIPDLLAEIRRLQAMIEPRPSRRTKELFL